MLRFIGMKYLLFACAMIFLDVVGCGHRQESDYLNVSADKIVFENQTDSIAITVFSNIKWVTESDSWLEISPLSGSGSAEVMITAQPNESTSGRSSDIVILGGDIERKVHVYQKGKALADD